MPPAELEDALEHRSGLLGLTGSADMEAVLAAEHARRRATPSSGVDVYLHRLRAGIAAMASAMDGLDALVFTGGVGENAPSIRSRAADGLGFLGVAVAPDRNAQRRSTPRSARRTRACGSSRSGRGRTSRSREACAARSAAGLGDAQDDESQVSTLAAIADYGVSAREWMRMSAHHRLARPADHLGATLSFRDGTTSRVFRETVVVGATTADPVLLVIGFRLAFLDDLGPLHAGFRRECLIHTPLFAGFRGFRSKLWLEDEDTRIYRGVYQWDGATDAAAYAARMVGLLAPFSNRGTRDLSLCRD